MGTLTLNDIASALAFIVALGGSVGIILKFLSNAIKKAFEPIYKRLNDAAMESCKNFLVQILSSAERGEPLTEMEKIRLSEQYGYYTKHDGNSYIKEWHERLKTEGKL